MPAGFLTCNSTYEQPVSVLLNVIALAFPREKDLSVRCLSRQRKSEASGSDGARPHGRFVFFLVLAAWERRSGSPAASDARYRATEWPRVGDGGRGTIQKGHTHRFTWVSLALHRRHFRELRSPIGPRTFRVGVPEKKWLRGTFPEGVHGYQGGSQRLAARPFRRGGRVRPPISTTDTVLSVGSEKV